MPIHNVGMRTRLPENVAPLSLAGPLAIDSLGLPRYWAMAWAVLDGADLAESHLVKQLTAIERLYAAVEERTGTDCLDRLLTDTNLDMLEPILEGLFVDLRNRGLDTGESPGETWRMLITFVRKTVDRISKSVGMTQLNDLHARLLRLDQLYAQLNPGQRRRSTRIRALPAAVVEDLYELVNPLSSRNPFRSADIAHRNFALFLLVLHQGLRRGEACVLPLDAIKEGWDPKTGGVRHWIDITVNPYEAVDPRYARPALKTVDAVRQLPIAEPLVSVIDAYATNYRGKQRHSFLFASQKDRPLALHSVNMVLDVLSERLSPAAKRELRDRRHVEKVTPHDLRHTAAVFRLMEFINAGCSMQVALDALKIFFGWSKKSEMPQHYARAYFEDRLATVWNTSFDTHIDYLRQFDDRGDK